jgi:hypothetical protein
MSKIHRLGHRLTGSVVVLSSVWAAVALSACSRSRTQYATFPTPEKAVEALTQGVKAGDLDGVLVIFGPEGRELIDSSDSATARQSREIFTTAVDEQWRLVDEANGVKTLVIGNEGWPFPVPLVKDANGWRFDTAAGKEEVIARRIGRNELAVIDICRTYVIAQRLYARDGHDGKPPGLYARKFRSDRNKQNGLYWPAAPGRKRSPLGDLLTEAELETRTHDASRRQPSPFHGYYFRILEAQGSAAARGDEEYVVNGEMSKGFALVAWPATYDVTGVMTFVVNHDGLVHEKDLGSGTDQLARAITRYDPDDSWMRLP